MYITQNDGWIEVITGPMFAGKTEELIRRIRRLQYANQNIIVRTKSICISKSSDIMEYVTDETNVVAIDEIQFLDEDAVDICEYLADHGVRVIVSGLDRDFRGEPFSFMPRLLSLAEYVTKLSAICVKCHTPATRTQRIIDGKPARYDDPIILVGAKDSYEARCRECHDVPGKPKRYDKLRD
jgi:thymidine kinase